MGTQICQDLILGFVHFLLIMAINSNVQIYREKVHVN